MIQLNNGLVLVEAALEPAEADLAPLAARQMAALLLLIPDCSFAIQGRTLAGSDRISWQFVVGQAVVSIKILKAHLPEFLAVVEPELTTYDVPLLLAADGWSVSQIVDY